MVINVSGKNPSLSADGVAGSIALNHANLLTVTGHTLAVGSGRRRSPASSSSARTASSPSPGRCRVTHSGGPADPSISFANGDGARIDVLSGGTLDLASDANRVLANGTNFLIHVFSGGTLKETATGLNEGGSTVDIPIDNDGQIARDRRPPPVARRHGRADEQRDLHRDLAGDDRLPERHEPVDGRAGSPAPARWSSTAGR